MASEASVDKDKQEGPGGEWSVVDSCVEKENDCKPAEEEKLEDSKLVEIKEEPSAAKEIKDDSLIITNEEDLDIATEEKPESSPGKLIIDEATKKKETVIVKQKNKMDDVNHIWVTNINRQTKATDLKDFFIRQGKVMTAKIVTNGAQFFGYVCMQNHDTAVKCIELLNGNLLDGKKVNLSMERPDLTKRREEKKPAPVLIKSKVEKLEVKEKKDPLTKKYKPEEQITEVKEVKKKKETDWKAEYQKAKTESEASRRRLLESNRRFEGLQSHCRRVEADLKKREQELKEERRRHFKEKEELEKKFLMDTKRFLDDRTALNKDMEEVRQLREHLKLKIKEVDVRVHKHRKSRSSSPRRSNIGKKKWSDERMHRSPPPPPKLSENRKRHTDSMRHYYEEKKNKRSPQQQFGFNESRGRHRTDPKPPSVRNPTNWPVPSYQEGWRVPNVPNSQFPAPERYPPYPVPTPFMGSSITENGSFYRPTEYRKY